ncbi:MAG TPA: hypothetical protein VGQ76_28595 [Thermoanaerobaculia bacterium]|jgi:hypothetical protein|nr:hypothetical protein [Thermoanaerobaculia bacterium]
MIHEPELTPEKSAEIQAAIAEAALGGGLPAEEVLRELRARRNEYARRRVGSRPKL